MTSPEKRREAVFANSSKFLLHRMPVRLRHTAKCHLWQKMYPKRGKNKACNILLMKEKGYEILKNASNIEVTFF
jgi:hypothetical protein